MSRSSARFAAFALFTGFIVSGCGETTTPTTTSGDRPSLIVAASTPGVVDTGEFEVCKYGSAADFTYTINGGPTQNLSLADGGCAVIAETIVLGPGNITVSITETADATIVLDSIVPTTNIIFDPAGTRGAPITGTATFSGTFNGDRGILAEFYNSPAPPPPDGCTFTQGYWKNHTDVWPAPYTPGATFYTSGKTWLQVFNTAPKGNAYYILAHQFMAATLNVANSAGVPGSVTTALGTAAGYFADPAGSTLTRTDLINLATLLDNYNNGLLGTPHCP